MRAHATFHNYLCKLQGMGIFMDRLTKTSDTHHFYVENTKVRQVRDGYSGEAVDRLAMFENVHEDLIAKQSKLSKELEALRSEGKTHSVKFKQLLADKLSGASILILFETYGLK